MRNDMQFEQDQGLTNEILIFCAVSFFLGTSALLTRLSLINPSQF